MVGRKDTTILSGLIILLTKLSKLPFSTEQSTLKAHHQTDRHAAADPFEQGNKYIDWSDRDDEITSFFRLLRNNAHILK